MTSAEPTAANGLAPVMSTFVDRFYARLPGIYRMLDAQGGYPFKRYLGGALDFGGQIDDTIESLRGSRPVGPATPEPWGLPADELALWRANRATVPSLLADPDNAPVEWLPWLAQTVGAWLPAAASLAERRDIIGGSGYRGGTRSAIAAAAQSALTGSRYVSVIPHRQGLVAGGVWDITVLTRSTETPNGQAVLDTIVRKGAKPAGAKLWWASFGTSWDKVEALFPTWADWEAHTWDTIEEAGITYADVPDNILSASNPSFETTVSPWVGRAVGGSVPTLVLSPSGGIDGASSGRLTMVGATGGMQVSTPVITDARILPGRDYIVGLSGRPSVALPARIDVEWQTAAGAAISTTSVTVGNLAATPEWNRAQLTTRHTAPANAAKIRMSATITAAAAGQYVDWDAALFRLISTTGG